MIKIVALDKQGNLVTDLPLEDVRNENISWYWVDFNSPTKKEIDLLTTFFKFHELLVEDCLTLLERPKIEITRQQIFLVSHVLRNIDTEYETLNMFIGKNYIVTFHLSHIRYISKVTSKVLFKGKDYTPLHIMHMLISEIVEGYSPLISKIENRLDELEESDAHTKGSKIMNEVFDLRSDLLKLRRGLLPMRELIHRFLVSRRVEMTENDRKYFHDIYDELVQQTEIVEASRELASDIRENYMTYNSFRSNNIMMTLTVISTIFLPLTFLAGVYGMNFTNMPELNTKYGYYILWLIMFIIAGGMLWYFKRKGWFDMF
ncbi:MULTISPECIES: magnesium/cobalt transporter CorA [unclassified Gemella]|uniref:magnesium/cobalt transporter CorA n=1 Tax=unclassified Gemella TaxID=2624949 RepID=UPI001C0509E0|nr:MULTISPECIES: magnesium/cobalt transporter CorA [unclassified Gemella]MBU0278506.1 magnesium/cobalt transporter CorA [Gemella sp. zg-1178]QWQ39457.1 magnesium/cobalt transporter CorA [Gemella sp. zg-570]